MPQSTRIAVLSLVTTAWLSAGLVSAEPVAPQAPAYPPTRTVEAVDTLFGVSVPDPYRWLENGKDPEVLDWTRKQADFARGVLDQLPGRDRLLARYRELYYLETITPPEHRGNRYFYTRTHKDKEKEVVYWKEGQAGAERVLIDPNLLSADGSVALGGWWVSWDGKWVAYNLKPNNADEATLHVMDVASGKNTVVDVIPGTKHAGPSWTPESDGFYYEWLPTDPNIPVTERDGYLEMRFHKLGSSPGSDPVVREKTGDPQIYQNGGLSRDGHWLLAYNWHGYSRSDVYFRDARIAGSPWKTLTKGGDGLNSVSVWKDRFYIATNEGASRWRIFVADPEHPERDNWKEIVPERPDAALEPFSSDIVGEHLALLYIKNASSVLELRSLDGKLVREIDLPGIGSTGGGVAGEPDEDEAFYGFSSYTQPNQIFRTSLRSGETTLWNEVEVPVDPSPFTVEQVWYPSKDGTKISMFLVHRKDLKKDGRTPFLLSGYGGFAQKEVPFFAAGLYPWLEAGGGYAVPNLRGNGEYGEEWHRGGMRDKKQNTFDDFIAAAEFLIANGYTKSERLAIKGGSNGGLLVGAALTQRPDLARVVVCGAPLLDMLRYHLFGSGGSWTDEYGSPEKEAEFKWLRAYSPYHHVKPAAYPAVIFMSPESDDRVDPLHARKMTAALQASTSSGRLILLRIEQNAGHGGADLVKQAVEYSADNYGFMMQQLGMTPAPRP